MTKVAKLRHNEYYCLQETFDNLYADSQQGKVFNKLMEIISSPENIRLAYRNIKRNNGSKTYGTDKCTIEDIKSIPTDKYVEIVQRKLNYYQPKPVRRVEIPKPNGKTRPLGIPAIVDRLVQQCILQVLEPICEAKFHERNNGFRPNRSAENAIAQCCKMIQVQKLHFVVDIDIKGFFDNVNHNKLINQIWTMGIRDKKLICIIKSMLKAPIVLPNGDMEYPNCGTPIKSTAYAAMKKTNLKEMYIVRYADDFKIFCRKRSDADRVFIAVKQWLYDRLKLEISEEKSKVVNLKRHYSDFLGFKLKAVKRGDKYIVRSQVSDKVRERIMEKLIEQIKKIQKPSDKKRAVFEIQKYNQMVEGFQNYFCFATCISIDCRKIQRRIDTVVKSRLRQMVKRTEIIENKHIKERYGKSKQIRFVNDKPIIPISYVKAKNSMYKKRSICKYTESGRAEIHKNLKFDDYVLWVMEQMLYGYKSTDSIEFTDNKISLYASQYGKCAVLGIILDYDEIHCHHKTPKQFGGKDNYQNLVILHNDIHKLIHAVKQATIDKYLSKLNLNQKQIKKINSLRKMAHNKLI